MDREKRGFLTGCVLGDGSLGKTHGSNSGRFSLTHGVSQEGYLRWKVERIRKYLNSTTEAKIRLIDNNGYPGLTWSKTHKVFGILHKQIYTHGVKTFSRQVLDHLTIEGIAVWYMDDGSLSYKTRKKTGTIHARELTLNTYESKETNQLIIDYFQETYGLSFGLNKSKGWYRLRMGTREAWKFLRLIYPYLHESMLYKADMKYPEGSLKGEEYLQFLERPTP